MHGHIDMMIDWISQQGCEASMEEIKAFLIEKGEEIQESEELTPEELEQIAGGSITTPGCLAGIIATFTLLQCRGQKALAILL